jgi:hypothetical protein
VFGRTPKITGNSQSTFSPTYSNERHYRAEQFNHLADEAQANIASRKFHAEMGLLQMRHEIGGAILEMVRQLIAQNIMEWEDINIQFENQLKSLQ